MSWPAAGLREPLRGLGSSILFALAETKLARKRSHRWIVDRCSAVAEASFQGQQHELATARGGEAVCWFASGPADNELTGSASAVWLGKGRSEASDDTRPWRDERLRRTVIV